MKKTPQKLSEQASVELHPDAWERFEGMTRKVMGAKVERKAGGKHPKTRKRRSGETKI